jgi:hypothetical protein
LATFYPLRKVNQQAVDVGTTSSVILPANEHRKFCVLVNDSNANIYISFGSPASINNGIRISAGGFSFEIDNTNLWVGEIHAIHSGTGTKRLLIQEMQ